MISISPASCRPTTGNFVRNLATAVFAILFLTAATTPAHAQISQESDTLLHRMYASSDFEVKYPGPARWLDDGAGFTTVEPSAAVQGAADIVRYETATGKRDVLVSASKLIPAGASAPLHIEDYGWSKDKSKLLIYTNGVQVWRLPTRGDYWVLDIANGTLKKLGGDAPASTLMFAKFSPDGKRVAYVRANNIYVEDLASGKITQLTTDGSDKIVNGTSDWVNEEELDIRDGFRWSPDGTKIAYWNFDTSGVGIFKLIYNLGKPKEIVTGFPYPGLGVYPTVLDIPIPIPGSTNSAVRAGVVSASGGPTTWMQVPGDPRENYIARIEWASNSNELAIEHLNRLQNESDVLLANANDGSVKQIFSDTDKAWVGVNDEIEWVHDGAAFLWLSERDGWRHAYLVSRDGSKVQLLTPGPYDVMGLPGVNEKTGYLFFYASPENATQKYLFRTKLDGSGKAERVSPLSQLGTHEYDISPDGEWAFHMYSRADVVPVFDLVDLTAEKSVRVLEDNAELAKTVAPMVIASPTEFFKVQVDPSTTLDAWMLKPPNFDASKKYPVLVFVYGEPAAQTVRRYVGGVEFRLSPYRGAGGLHRSELRQSRHSRAEGTRVAQAGLRRDSSGDREGPVGSAEEISGGASVCRCIARGSVGMERRRVEHTEFDVPRARSL